MAAFCFGSIVFDLASASEMAVGKQAIHLTSLMIFLPFGLFLLRALRVTPNLATLVLGLWGSFDIVGFLTTGSFPEIADYNLNGFIFYCLACVFSWIILWLYCRLSGTSAEDGPNYRPSNSEK